MSERNETIFMIFLMILGTCGMLYACSIQADAVPRADNPKNVARTK